MKNLFLTFALLLIASFTFATNSIEKDLLNEKESVLKIEKVELKEKPVCTVTVTVYMADGSSYSATAGNWFSTCAGAERRAKAKIFDQMFK